jgi:hypothetical protein
MAVPFVLRTPPDPPTPERVQFDVAPPAGVRLSTYFALSPDGRHLAYTAGGADRQIGLWVHTFATGRSRQLDAAGVMDSRMFWSPDSDAIGYSRLGRLEKVDLAGGPAETLVSEMLGFGGASWSRGGTIVYAAQEGLFKVPATGGAPTPLTQVDASRGETTHSAPWFLPDGRHFLYLRTSTDAGTAGAFIGSIDSTPQTQPADRLLAAAHDVRYVSSRPDAPGHLVFVRDDTAMAVPFDPVGRRMLGDASPIAPGVGSDGTYPFTSASAAGSVAIRLGGAAGGGKPLWVDRTGRTLAEMAPSLTDATFPRISPDGTRVAVVTAGDIWVYHVDGRPPVRVTFEGSVYSPLWTPDGERIVYETSGGLLALAFADGRGGSAEQPFPPGHHHRRTVARVCLDGDRHGRDLGDSLPHGRGRGSRVSRRGRRAALGAGWPRAVLHRRAAADGGGRRHAGRLPRRRAEDALRWPGARLAAAVVRRRPGRTLPDQAR